jgi:hypothetical protein
MTLKVEQPNPERKPEAYIEACCSKSANIACEVPFAHVHPSLSIGTKHRILSQDSAFSSSLVDEACFE